MADPNTATNLAASLPLADVHLQAPPGYWPLAWGWWLCLAIALAATAAGVHFFMLHRQKQQARKEAMRQLQQFNDPSCFNQINLLLRQTTMSYYPRQHVAGLTGDNWLVFLDSHLDSKYRGFVALSETWLQGLYSPEGLEPQAFNECYRQATLWLKKARLPARQTHLAITQEVKDA